MSEADSSEVKYNACVNEQVKRANTQTNGQVSKSIGREQVT